MVPQIIPIKDLKNTSQISEMCKKSSDPIFVTKNGYSDMVVMGIDTYKEMFGRLEMYQELAVSENQFAEGKYKEARSSLNDLRKKYDL